MIYPCRTPDEPGWLELRTALWPHCSAERHLAEMTESTGSPDRYCNLLWTTPEGVPSGLAEASIRTDYVNGTRSSPVAFLEGIYVVPERRRTGVARALVEAVEAWARERGCSELASDALLENAASHGFHRAVGFEETERVVFFRKQASAGDVDSPNDR